MSAPVEPGHRDRPRVTARALACEFLLLTLAVWVFFSWSQARWSAADWPVPVRYKGDSLYNMALARTLAEAPPPWDIRDARLNAPFTADLNAYPITEKIAQYLYGLLAALFAPGLACTLSTFLAQWTAALGFHVAARMLGAGRVPAAACALLFAFSHYLVQRADGLAVLAYVVLVPLFFVLADRLIASPQPGRRLWLGSLALSGLAAFFNPYYGFFLLFLLFAALAFRALRGEWRLLRWPAALAAFYMACFALNQANVFLDRLRWGENPAAVYRTFAHVDRWSLRLADLIWPTTHVWDGWSRFAAAHYFGGGRVIDEDNGTFLGITGLLALLALALVAVRALARGRPRCVPAEAWVAGLAVVFAVAGGITHLMGSFGFMMLRCSSRYSVMLLCAGLLFLARGPLTRWSRLGAGLALALLALRLWELAPAAAAARERREQIRPQVAADRAFARALEAGLPRGAMVFQLPVAQFPEGGRIHRMGDYEHVRPYLWSQELRFSYGGCKDRPREAWQRRTAAKPAAEMVRELESLGFAALYVNRRGFADDGAALERDLRALGLPVVAESEPGALIAFRLQPAAQPALPRAEPALVAAVGDGFLFPPHAPDTPDRLWSCGDARLVVQRGEPGDRLVEFGCLIESPTERRVRLRFAGETLWSGTLKTGEVARVRHTLRLDRPSAALRFETEPGPAFGAAGGFLVAFALGGLYVRALPTEPPPRSP